MRPALLALLPVLLLASEASGLRVMSYNVLNYTSGRANEFQTVLQETQPDLVIVQEIYLAGTTNFRNLLNSVNPGEWALGPYVDGNNSDNAIYYRTAKCSVVAHHVIGTALRDIDEWRVRSVAHGTPAADLRVYAVHLKSSQGSDNVAKRLAEVQAMRARMETFAVGQDYTVMGDFNIYRSTESPYQYMINPGWGLAGVLQDPIDREGNWHENVLFADIHTQSPRTTQFGGGAHGGMDDRFDMQLVSPASEDGEGWDILDATYEAFGQDGQHFNGALNVAPFLVVSQEVAQALHDASDHLPVCAEWQIPARLSTVASLDVGTVIVGGALAANLSVENVAPGLADELDYALDAPVGFTAPPGTFELAAGATPALHAIGLDSGAAGGFAGDLEVTSDDPDAPLQLVALTGTVLDHAVPSTLAGIVELHADVSFAVVTGDTASVSVPVHNVGWNALQAALDVYDAQLTGDPRFFLPSFGPALVEGTPLPIGVSFDAAGASDGLYEATLTVSTRDRTDLAGWTDLDGLTFDLGATVGNGTGVTVTITASRTGLGSLAPNPFERDLEIRFALANDTRAELLVYDVRGRLVRSLVGTGLAAGEHRVRWDGLDAHGQALAPGLYFVRFVADNVAETRKVVRLR